MPIRNLWSLEPGECVTAEKIMRELEDCEVCFPLRDVGVDLYVIKRGKHVGVQVKESRYYSKFWRGTLGHSWHQVYGKKLLRDSGANFYIFLTYLPVYERRRKRRLSSFKHKFVIVPTDELKRRIQAKRPTKRGVYSFCFHFDGKRVIDKREVLDEEELMDYSMYLDNWGLLREALI